MNITFQPPDGLIPDNGPCPSPERVCECCGRSRHGHWAEYGVDTPYVTLNGGTLTLCRYCFASFEDMPKDFVSPDEKIRSIRERMVAYGG